MKEFDIDLTVERVYTGTIEQGNCLNAIADRECKVMDIVGFYEDCIVAHSQKLPVDFKAINNAIVERWSNSALERIKKKAWKRLGDV